MKLLARLEANDLPWLGDRPIRDTRPSEFLSVMRRVESRGVLETAHRLMNYCRNIYRYAVATGRAERELSSDLRGALPPSTPRHHASLTLRAWAPYYLSSTGVVGSLGPHGSFEIPIRIASFNAGPLRLIDDEPRLDRGRTFAPLVLHEFCMDFGGSPDSRPAESGRGPRSH